MDTVICLAYIGPGPGYLLDPRGPGPYLLAAGVVGLAWFVVQIIRGKQGKP